MPRILFVHGAGCDARVWAPVIAHLPRHWDAQVVTLTYFGEDEWPDDGARFGTTLHAQDVVARAEAMGGEVHVVGWSYAVHVVLEALLARPDLFAGALLYEPGLGQYVTDEAAREAYGRDAGSLYGAVGARLEREGTEAAVRQLVGAAFATLLPDMQAMHLANARTMPLLMGGGQAPAKLGPDLLARIATPTLVAMGEKTRPAFAIPSRTLAEALPGARLQVVPGADHFLPQSAPAQFAALVADWIESAA